MEDILIRLLCEIVVFENFLFCVFVLYLDTEKLKEKEGVKIQKFPFL